MVLAEELGLIKVGVVANLLGIEGKRGKMDGKNT
jgi:hypothetical protein